MLNDSLRAMLQIDLAAETSRAAIRRAFAAGLAAGLHALADQAEELWRSLGDPAAPLDPDLLADEAVAALHQAVDDTTLADPAEYRRRLLSAAALAVLAAAGLRPEIEGSLQ